MKRKKQTPRRRKYAVRRKRVVSKRYYDGPSSWLIPMMEETYARLVPKEEAERTDQLATRARAPRTKRAVAKKGIAAFRSSLTRDRGEEVLAPIPRDFWLRRLQEYQQRKAVGPAARARVGLPPAPAIPGANNWVPRAPPEGRPGRDPKMTRPFYRLADTPRPIILVACRKCEWMAAFTRDDLIAAHGADCPMPNLLAELASPSCTKAGQHWDRCGAYYLEPIDGPEP